MTKKSKSCKECGANNFNDFDVCLNCGGRFGKSNPFDLNKLSNEYKKLHRSSIIETYGSRKKFKNSLKQRMKLNKVNIL